MSRFEPARLTAQLKDICWQDPVFAASKPPWFSARFFTRDQRRSHRLATAQREAIIAPTRKKGSSNVGRTLFSAHISKRSDAAGRAHARRPIGRHDVATPRRL